ncbi:MAG: AAA family ATPase [bacterium]|nr:MAG: AAA family ATPase [bacterium]
MIRILKLQYLMVWLMLIIFTQLSASQSLFHKGDLIHHSSAMGKQEVSLSKLVMADVNVNEIKYQGSEELIMKDQLKFKSVGTKRYRESFFLSPKQTAKKFLVLSGHTGVGKSVLAISLANILSQDNGRVILVNLSRYNASVKSWLEKVALDNDRPMKQPSESQMMNANIVSLSTTLDYLDYKEDAAGKFYDIENTIEYYRAIFKPFTSEYDYIIFDTQTGLNELNLALLRDSDKTILVSTPDVSSISDVYSLIKTSSSFTTKAKFYLVINQVIEQKSSIEAHRKLNFALRQFLNSEIELLGLIPADDILKNSALQYQIFQNHPEKFPALTKMKRIAQSLLSEPRNHAVQNMV